MKVVSYVLHSLPYKMLTNKGERKPQKCKQTTFSIYWSFGQTKEERVKVNTVVILYRNCLGLTGFPAMKTCG